MELDLPHRLGSPGPDPSRPRRRWWQAVAALILREVEGTFGRSPGGYLWTILEPAAGIAIMSIVFNFVLRMPPLGANFPLFFASGILPFLFYTTVGTKLASAIQYSRPLLSYPALTFTDALLARLALNSMTQILVFAIVIGTILMVWDLRLTVDWIAIGTAFGMLLSLTFSVGTLNCFLSARFPVWVQIWAVLNRPMFLVSGVLFLPEHVPVPYRDVFLLNPLVHVISQFRKGLYAYYDAPFCNPVYVFVVSIGLGAMGLLLLIRNSQKILLL